MLRRLAERLRGLLRLGPRVVTQAPPPVAGRKERGQIDHVILLDGTMASLMPGQQTSIGLIWQLLRQSPQARTAVYYDPGSQWEAWRQIADVAMGLGINAQIKGAYGWLANRYRPGDRIFLFGYSRGAFAVRSLTGIIDQVGLLRPEAATERNVRLAWRYYQSPGQSRAEAEFRRRFCHASTEIEMAGVFDTVKALGVRLPFLWMWTEPQHQFHNHALGPSIRHGFHALALNESRAAFQPILWETTGDWRGRVEQVWFRGTHGDIGGMLGGYEAARPLANIPLTWMLSRAEGCGLRLPDGWQARFPTNPDAPSVGMTRGWGKAFLLHARRPVGNDPSERIHLTARSNRRARWFMDRNPRLQADSTP